MRLPRPRYTLRSLMAVVAIAALLMGVEVLRRRRGHFLLMAERETNRVAELRESLLIARFHHGESLDKMEYLKDRIEGCRERAVEAHGKRVQAQRVLDALRLLGLPTMQSQRREPWYWSVQAHDAESCLCETEAEIAFHDRRIDHHVRMKWRFKDAASRPWITVIVDPEPPDEFRLPVRPAPPPPPP